MEQSRKVCVGAAALTGAALAVAAGLLAWTTWGDQSTPVIINGGVTVSEVTQLDRVSALNNSQSLQGDAEAEYFSAHTERTTLRLSRTINAAAQISEAELTETDVTVTQTTVYVKANTESQVVCYLLPGTVLTDPAQEDDQDWYEVYYEGMCGFVQAECLELDVDSSEYAETEALTYDDTYGTVICDQTIYAQADSTAETVAALSEGDAVQLLSAEDGWYYVYYQGVNGYLSTDYVAQTTEKPDWKQEEEAAAALAALRSNIVATAQNYLGCSYVWSAAGPSSFDCSGFTMYIMKQYGISLPHSANEQYTGSGVSITKDELQPGDLVFFSSSGTQATHVGIYIGDGQFIHASSSRGVVTINNLTDSWYSAAYIGARRVVS